MRVVRQAPAQADFDRITLGEFDLRSLGLTPWFRLASVRHASHFHANPGARLTPRSMAFPSVYLAEDKETTVAEVWGDKFYAQRLLEPKIYSIPRSEAAVLRFFTCGDLPRLNLCDLTDADTRMSVGIEDGTLYNPDLKIPQGWAEVIARHPQHFDGILYRSRITGRLCFAAWNRPGRLLEREITFTDSAPFLESPESYSVARKTGVKLSFTY
jgi:RES domain-containing protein